MENPLSSSKPWSLVAGGYNDTTRLMLSPYSEQAIAKQQFLKTDHVLDIACGPGTTSILLAPLVEHITAIDFSEQMLECFRRNLNLNNLQNIDLLCMDGQALDFADQSYDQAISMFGLIFFADRARGMQEIFRVLKPGGKVTISSWVPVDQSPMMQLMFETIAVALPSVSQRKTVAGLDDPEVFKTDLARAGFSNIKVEAINSSVEIQDATVFFNSMLKGSAPLQLLKLNMESNEWASHETQMRQLIQERLSDLPTAYDMPAWLGTGIKSK